MKILCGSAKKKPVEVQFFNYKGWSATHVAELKAWIESFGNRFEDVIEPKAQGKLRIKTLEGSLCNILNNSVIIRGVKGEFYPCDRKIFNITHDIVDYPNINS